MPISARAAIQKRIDKIQMTLANLHGQASEIFGDIEANEFAMQELQAVLKSLPDEEGDEGRAEIALRRGSEASKARDALRDVRKPLHVDTLLTAIGKEINKKTRASLAGQLGLYARKDQIFVKTGPNEFGLLEWTTAEAFKKGNSSPFMIVETVDEDEPAVSSNGHKRAPAGLSLEDEPEVSDKKAEPVALSLDDD
ncbi:MAG TPA: hypothetical protein VN956_25410 [Pyrinomonadaceae bacterium]|nr:hypothetical protein [Pyrinomonadaceae bacterium]